jgi:hypothetical protein
MSRVPCTDVRTRVHQPVLERVFYLAFAVMLVPLVT